MQYTFAPSSKLILGGKGFESRKRVLSERALSIIVIVIISISTNISCIIIIIISSSSSSSSSSIMISSTSAADENMTKRVCKHR